MLGTPRAVIHVSAQHQPVFRELGIDADAVFRHPLIKPWRMLDERENCILDTTLGNGQAIRWHVKRYQPARGFTTPADDEAKGHRALLAEQIPTAELIAWGHLPDRRSFVIFEDLTGYRAADKLVQAGVPFDQMLIPTADLAARLHRVGLHHRDLYLCHFFVKTGSDGVIDVRLIDPARVRRLPGFFTRTRWIVKDLAQFWYSTTELPPITDEQRMAWLQRYAEQRGLAAAVPLRNRIDRKVAWIARHDERLRRQHPKRNISIPTK
jgi:hypothetical protein